MARSRKRSHLIAGELNLTAMIDVAFQMLNFFVITMKPMDVLANLDVSRPAPSTASKQQKPPNFLRIYILNDGNITINDRLVSKENFERTLKQITTMNTKDVTVLIGCEPQSPHGKMVEVLDLCSFAGLTNLSLVSLN